MASCQQGTPRSQLENRQAANKSTAVVMPILLVGLVGYTSWVVVSLISVHYLIHPHVENLDARPGAGIAIITLYFFILLPVAITYFRVLGATRHPGYIPKGQATEATPLKPEEPTPQLTVQHSCTTTQVPDDRKQNASEEQRKQKPQGPPVTMLDVKAIFDGKVPPPPGTEQFYSKEVFVCDPSGLPIWCGICCNWKSDRAHHGSDVGRCVYKLDHFCPWVGGVVAEKNFNFFIQFNGYAALYWLFVLIVMAIFVAEVRNGEGTLNVNWIVILAISSVFTLFTGGMTGNSLNLALRNLSTIDHIGAEKRTMHLAVLLNGPPPPPPSAPAQSTSFVETPFQGTITYPLQIDPTLPTPPPQRTFAILRTHPGMNPWSLGTFGNFKAVMGNKWWEWFLPLHHSPCCNHDRGDSMYALGLDVERLKEDAGISGTRHGSSSGNGSRRRRRRKSRRSGDDSEDADIMGSTLANVNGVTGRERTDSIDSV